MAVRGDRHIVFDANADALPALIDLRLTFGHSQPITDVQPRLDGEHDAGLQSHRPLTQAIGTDVMHVEAEPVPGAMHIKVAIVAVFDHRVGLTNQKAEVQQSLHQHAQGGVVDLFRRRSRSDLGHRRLLGRQHKAVELPLLR